MLILFRQVQLTDEQMFKYWQILETANDASPFQNQYLDISKMDWDKSFLSGSFSYLVLQKASVVRTMKLFILRLSNIYFYFGPSL